MADVNVTDLTQETYSTLDGTEQVIMFDSAEGKRATVAAVGEYVLKKLTTSLNGSTQTVANALASLNSELRPTSITNVTDWADSCPTGISTAIITYENYSTAGAPIAGAYEVVCWKYSTSTIFVVATLVSTAFHAEYTFRKYSGTWQETWKDTGNVTAISLASNSAVTVFAPKGTVFISSRGSVPRTSMYVRDHWNIISEIINNGNDTVTFSISNDNVTITNANSASANTITVIRPHTILN